VRLAHFGFSNMCTPQCALGRREQDAVHAGDMQEDWQTGSPKRKLEPALSAIGLVAITP